jgi:large subunit ribosomal protein LP0
MSEVEVEQDTPETEQEQTSSKADLKKKKAAYFDKLMKYFAEYPKVILVGADNVGSRHLQNIRASLRGKAEILMGKNTMIRRAIKNNLKTFPSLEVLLPKIKGNFGFVFTQEDLKSIKDAITELKIAAPARAGALAPCNVVVPKGLTGLDPSQTSFMQALNIATKINKGQIEIINDVNLLKAGDKVGSSEATLLAKLNILPFSYGLIPLCIYDAGVIIPPSVVEMTTEDILSKLTSGIQNITALSVALKAPSMAAVPYLLRTAYRNLLAISLATEYTFERARKIKELLENPEALAALHASSAATASSAPAATTSAAAPQEEEKKEEKKEEEEEEDDAGFGDLFG